jgi:CheY-like chemotaxis protein
VPYTLLLADDSVTIQRVIELTFADEDVQVIAVSDGDQAIERLNSATPPDIVLADIGMPGKNGYEVAQHIRQTPRLAHIPVVLLTGAFEPVDQARAAEAGCDGVLAKPFEPQLVIGRVKELLARGRAPSAPVRVALLEPPDQLPQTIDQLFSMPESAPAQPAPIPPGELNDYFDRLDAAFSNAAPDAPPPLLKSIVSLPGHSSGASPPSPGAAQDAGEIDWFGTAQGEAPAADSWDLPGPDVHPESPDLSLSYAPPPPAVVPARVTPPAPAPLVTPDEPVVRPAPPLFKADEPVVRPAPPPLFKVDEPVVRPAPAPLFKPDETVVRPAPPPLFKPDESVVRPAPEKLYAPPIVIAPAASLVAAPSTPSAPAAPLEPDAPAFPTARVATFAAAAYLAPVAAPPAVAPVVPAHHTDLPPLADAFAALLAAEQSEPLTAIAPAWPGTIQPAAVVVSEEIIEQITRRVLDRLSDTAVRETVADIVSKVAEQLVRAEIERIKGSIK